MRMAGVVMVELGVRGLDGFPLKAGMTVVGRLPSILIV